MEVFAVKNGDGGTRQYINRSLQQFITLGLSICIYKFQLSAGTFFSKERPLAPANIKTAKPRTIACVAGSAVHT